ncbi:MAG: acyl carrier protein [Myxococcota bacterium]
MSDLEAYAAAHRRAHRAVLDAVMAVLDLAEPPGRAVEFARLGMDSLTAIEVRDRVCRALEVDLPTTLALDHPSVRRLTAAVAERLTADGLADALDHELDAVLGAGIIERS